MHKDVVTKLPKRRLYQRWHFAEDENFIDVSWKRCSDVTKWRFSYRLATKCKRYDNVTKCLTTSLKCWVNVVSPNILEYLEKLSFTKNTYLYVAILLKVEPMHLLHGDRANWFTHKTSLHFAPTSLSFIESCFFFSFRLFFHKQWQFTGQQGKEGDHLYSSVISTNSQTFIHLFAILLLGWLWRIFNIIACNYQTAFRLNFFFFFICFIYLFISLLNYFAITHLPCISYYTFTMYQSVIF